MVWAWFGPAGRVRVVVLSRWGFPDGEGHDGHSREEGRELKGNLELSFLDCFVFARRKVKKKRMYKLISATIFAFPKPKLLFLERVLLQRRYY